MTIIESFVVEHALLRGLFDEIERRLTPAVTLPEIHLMAGLIESLLQHHGSQEEDLVFAALDHVLEDRGERDRFYRDHQELDARFRKIQSAVEPSGARQLLRTAIRASRNHFAHEEESLFPLVAKVMSSGQLATLNDARAEHWPAVAG